MNQEAQATEATEGTAIVTAVSKKAPAKKTPAKKDAKKAPAKKTEVKKPKVPSEEKNGVTRPNKGTSSAKVWEIADSAHKTKAGAVRKNILEKAAAAGINSATAATQFARWRTFNGITAVAA